MVNKYVGPKKVAHDLGYRIGPSPDLAMGPYLTHLSQNAASPIHTTNQRIYEGIRRLRDLTPIPLIHK